MRPAITFVALAMVAGACATTSTATPSTAATTSGPSTTTPSTTTSSTTTTPTTTTTPSTTTTEALVVYAVSDDYIVETIAVIEDAAAGGLAYGDGFLYSADFGFTGHRGNTVFKIGLDGSVEVFSQPEKMSQGTGNAFGPDGTLYQSSYGSGDLFAIAPDGTATVVTGDLSGPAGIAVSPDGEVFVDDCNGNRVYRILENGAPDNFVRHTRFQCPNGLTMDGDGNLYVANFNHGLLHMITPDGDVSVLHEFPSPLGHVEYFDGQLFITARRDHLVYRYDLATDVADIIAGTGEAGSADGPGTEATIARPNALAIGPDGTVYINHGTADGNNPTYIRAIRPVG